MTIISQNSNKNLQNKEVFYPSGQSISELRTADHKTISQALKLDALSADTPELETIAKNRIIDCLKNQCTKLDLSKLGLSSLPESIFSYFDHLVSLNCSDNHLSLLPSLPQDLTALNCSNNQLILLPALPNSLVRLDCSENQLTSLSLSSKQLKILNCQNNYLDPASLKTIADSFYFYTSTTQPQYPKLLAEAYAYYRANKSFTAVNTDDIFPESARDLFDKIFEKYPGICFGESHDDLFSKQLLTENMQYFKSKGVTTLFIELSDEIQDDLDDFNKGEKLSVDTVLFVKKIDYRWNFKEKNGYLEILLKAHEAGIKIVAMDSKNPMTSNEIGRIASMNYYAIKKIENKSDAGKFIVFTGGKHLSTHLDAHHQQIPGIGPMTGIPTVMLLPSNKSTSTSLKISKNYIDSNGIVSNFAIGGQST